MAKAGTTRPAERELRLLLRRAVQANDQVTIAQVQRDFPDNKDVLKYSGFFHFRRNELVAAEDALVKAVVADPGDVQVVDCLMRVYFRARIYDKCEATAKEALRLAPGSVSALRTLGIIYHKRGAWAEAATAWKSLAAIVPGDAQVSLHLARALERQKVHTPAEEAVATDSKNHGELARIETGGVIAPDGQGAGAFEPTAHANSVDDRAVAPAFGTTAAPKGRTIFRAGVAAAVLLLALGGGYLMLVSKPVPQDPKVGDSGRILAEQGSADATTAEKRRLEEEKARRQAEADLAKAQQQRLQEAATEAEAKRKAEEAQAERQKAETAADARKTIEASAMQVAKEEKKAETPAVSKADEQNKVEGDAKALASQPPAPAPAPSPATTTIAPTPIAPSPDGDRNKPASLANPYDGGYAGTATFPSGPQSLSLRLVNGEGKGAWNTSCGAARFTLTIDLNGEANLSVDGFRADCSRSSQSLRRHVEDGQLKFPTRGISGEGVVSFTKSELR
jgi:hypothetical protein